MARMPNKTCIAYLHQGFLSSCLNYPDNIAVKCENSEYSYAEFSQIIYALIKEIYKTNKQKKVTRIAILGSRQLITYASIVASLSVGAAYIPLSTSFPNERIKTILEIAKPELLIIESTDISIIDKINFLEEFNTQLLIIDRDRLIAKSYLCEPVDLVNLAENTLANMKNSDIAYIMFTSGSTGKPKGVPISHQNAVTFINYITNRYQFSATDRFSQTFDITFDLSVFDLFVCWSVGAALFPMSKSQLLDPLDYIIKNSLTVWFSVPSMIKLIFNNDAHILKQRNALSLKYSLFCGEPLLNRHASLWKLIAPRAKLINLYGPTELTIACSAYELDDQKIDEEVVPIGKIFEHMDYILIPHPELPEKMGELCISGPQMFTEYLKLPEKNKFAFIEFLSDGKRVEKFYKTGDIVQETAHRNLLFKGRIDNQVKINGYRIELLEIEKTINNISGVEQCIVLPFPENNLGNYENLQAFVITKFKNKEFIMNELDKTLPRYMLPSNINFLDFFPLNLNGKIDRKALYSLKTKEDVIMSIVNIETLKEELIIGDKKIGKFISLKKFYATQKDNNISRYPVSIRILIENILRNQQPEKITNTHLNTIINWGKSSFRNEEIPLIVSRVILQDYTGVPLLVDLAAMRDKVSELGYNPNIIEPEIPVDLVIDHSVQTNFTRVADAAKKNMALEIERNIERYKFMKWGGAAFQKVKVIPPGVGIVHQVNLEYLAHGVIVRDGLVFPDTVVGTDSHTTMINGLGILGWGVGGIEAEGAMLGQPIYFAIPEVVGVHLSGSLPSGCTATDLVLTLTELLRKRNVVGKFVEFYGEGAASLPITDRATIANMAPDYGATMGYFPPDQKTLAYYHATGRTQEQIDIIYNYLVQQDLFGMPKNGECIYSDTIELNLNTVQPCVSGPKRPQDKILLSDTKKKFNELLRASSKDGGYGKEFYQAKSEQEISDGDVLIAGITSCTNTSNPSVLIAAGLLAKNAYEKGLTVSPKIKTSLAPGSKVVSYYLEKAGLQYYLDKLGFNIAGYGCTTCIGNVGELDPVAELFVKRNNIVAVSVLSGNRNFEARIHPSIKANFLMSPPLVIAFAIAGSINIDFMSEPLGYDPNNQPVYLRDIWPDQITIESMLHFAQNAASYKITYKNAIGNNELWNQIKSTIKSTYAWENNSTYIAKPPYFDDFKLVVPQELTKLNNLRVLAIFGDSVTTDHISPASQIEANSTAGQYLQQSGVAIKEFNSFGARRGHHEVMIRGGFSNPRIKNHLLPEKEGSFTRYALSGEIISIYDAAKKYQKENIGTVIFAGKEYGTGSSRDWAAKATALLGVKTVIAQSFERIHRSNLIQMGVLPLTFINENDIEKIFHLTGNEILDFEFTNGLRVNSQVKMTIKDPSDQKLIIISLQSRIDTTTELEYYLNQGILPYMLRNLIAKAEFQLQREAADEQVAIAS